MAESFDVVVDNHKLPPALATNLIMEFPHKGNEPNAHNNEKTLRWNVRQSVERRRHTKGQSQMFGFAVCALCIMIWRHILRPVIRRYPKIARRGFRSWGMSYDHENWMKGVWECGGSPLPQNISIGSDLGATKGIHN